jgi:hypothetical protein
LLAQEVGGDAWAWIRADERKWEAKARLRTDSAGQRADPPLEFPVQVAKLDVAQQGVSRESKPGEQREEDKAVPKLQPPANRLKNHSAPPIQ